MTAGESHGPALVAILEGVPAGVEVTSAEVSHGLARRRLGYAAATRPVRNRAGRLLLSTKLEHRFDREDGVFDARTNVAHLAVPRRDRVDRERLGLARRHLVPP